MGGTVAVTIKKDGVIKKMARKTGSYNWMLFSGEMLDGNLDKAYADYCKKFDEMRDDFLSGEPYKYPMSGVYGWCDICAPISYGLVFIDLDEKKIHSMQGYDSPGQFIFNEVYLEKEQKKYLNNDDNRTFFKDFIEKDLVNIVFKEGDGNKRKEVSILEFLNGCNLKSFKSLENILEAEYSRMGFLRKKDLIFVDEESKKHIVKPYDIKFKLKDFELMKYPEDDVDAYMKMFAELKPFLNAEDIKGWREYLEEKLNDYHDEKIDEMDENNESEEDIENYIEAKKSEILKNFDNYADDNLNKGSKKTTP